MAEETPRNEQSAPLNVDIDLTSLNDLALGPRWSSGPVSANMPRQSFRDDRERGPRPPRSSQQGQRKDRRPPRQRSDAAAPAAEGEQRQPRGERPARSERSDRPQRDNRGPRREYSRQAPPPPFKPVVQIALYPEEAPFKKLSEAIKNSGRTYELFEIARLILEKPERFVLVIHPLPEAQSQVLHISAPDNLPFLSEEEAIAHVFSVHADKFFDVEEVEVEAPKGNFQIVSRCGITGELLAPPNYHRYQQILQAHHAARLANMPYERFVSRIETVREKEAIDQWVEKMRKQTRYKLKEAVEGVPSEFDSLDSARFQLVLHAKDKLVRTVQNARFEGRLVEVMPEGDIRTSLETVLEQQRRFPLDTANNLRGRLRRMGFSVYKKGSKGISYVCAIRRAFRKPGETFGESVQQLVEFIEAHPGFPATDLPKEYLGTEIPEGGDTAMSAEDQERLRLLRNDLRWLITSGYVTEYSNGKLFAPPPMDGASQGDDDADAKDASADAVAESQSAEAVETAVKAEVAEEVAPVEEAASVEEPVRSVAEAEEAPAVEAVAEAETPAEAPSEEAAPEATVEEEKEKSE
ncbi:MAG: hypothetical protein JW942_09690 [Opitutales bacterium]|nr:hypothetical protein [Opitutales bacterium]